jgi:hypothetical protein
MEDINIKKQNRSDFKQNIFLILLVVAICVMIFTVLTLIKNKNIILSDAISYGMKSHNFKTCSCFDDSGNLWYSEGNGFVSQNGGIIFNGTI